MPPSFCFNSPNVPRSVRLCLAQLAQRVVACQHAHVMTCRASASTSCAMSPINIVRFESSGVRTKSRQSRHFIGHTDVSVCEILHDWQPLRMQHEAFLADRAQDKRRYFCARQKSRTRSRGQPEDAVGQRRFFSQYTIDFLPIRSGSTRS